MKISKFLVLGTLLVSLCMVVPTIAATPTFTGDVEFDFTGPGVLIISDPVPDVGMPGTPPGITGWDLAGLRLTYDSGTDTMYVGLNSSTILGDADGDGDPGVTSAYLLALTGADKANLGESETAAVYFDLNQDGTYDVIGGISGLTDITGFSVNTFSGAFFPPFNFGTPLAGNIGTVSASPSASSPDLEFSITQWSSLPNQDSDVGFSVGAFCGSLQDAGIGEDFIAYTQSPSTDVGISASAIDAGTVDLIVTEHNDSGDGTPLTDVEVVVDDGSLIATLNAGNVTSGDGGVAGVLEDTETWTWSYTAIAALENVAVGTGKTFTATGRGTDPAGFVVTYPGDPDEQASVTVTPLPEIRVVKMVDCEVAVEGYPVRYQICIQNIGPVEVTPTLIEDTHLGNLTADFLAACPTLAPGTEAEPTECCLIFPPLTEDPLVLPTTSNPFENTVSFSAIDTATQTNSVGPATDNAEVLFLTPDFTVEKVCLTDPILEGEEEAWFEITITNTGDVDLIIALNENVFDDLLNPILAYTPITLADDATLVYTVVLPVIDGDVYNEVEVCATMLPDTEICFDLGDFPICKSANDTCSVSVQGLCYGDETAWAYGGTNAKPLWDYAKSNNWGWTNGPLSAGTYIWDLYAGAGKNILSKGTLVGTVTVVYDGGCVTVTYAVDQGYYLGGTHLWIGNDPLPSVKRGKKADVYTNAPGQFPYGGGYSFDPDDSDTWETEWSSGELCDFEGEIYVAAHCGVWMEVECPPEICDNDIDDDRDGLVDELDPDCQLN